MLNYQRVYHVISHNISDEFHGARSSKVEEKARKPGRKGSCTMDIFQDGHGAIVMDEYIYTWLDGKSMVNLWLIYMVNNWNNNIVTYTWVNLITTSLFSRTLEIIVSKGNHPKMAQHFRLVKYYDLPRYTHMRTMVLVYLPTKLGDFGCSGKCWDSYSVTWSIWDII